MSKVINLTQGKFAIVDDIDFEYLNKWKWYAEKVRSTFYASRDNINGGPKRMHVAIMGNSGTKMQVDHIDRNGLNNQRSNLRLCSQAQNICNKSPKKNGKSKYIGVTWCSIRLKWIAQLSKTLNGKRKNILYKVFDNEIDAAKAYNETAIKTHGEFASLNII